VKAKFWQSVCGSCVRIPGTKAKRRRTKAARSLQKGGDEKALDPDQKGNQGGGLSKTIPSQVGKERYPL